MAIFADTFTGTTGAAWSGAWVNARSTGGTSTIDANRGKHVTSAAGGYADGRGERLAFGTSVDVDITGTLMVPTLAESFPQVWFRAASTLNTNGYKFSFEPSYNSIRFYKKVSGTQTGLGSAVSFTFAANTVYSWRVQATGTTLRAKVWTGAEPGAWTVSITDSSFTTAGSVGLVTEGGAAAAAVTAYWDDFSATVDGAVASFTGTLATTVNRSGDLQTGMTGALAETVTMTGGVRLGAKVGPGTRATSVTLSGNLAVVSRRFVGALEIEFSPGVWTDVTSRLAFRISPLRLRFGRPTEFDEVGPGALSCALWNEDGALMPDNQGSPYWPNVVEGKRIRWKVTKSSVTYTRFVGWIQAIVPDFPDSSTVGAVVSIVAGDALGLLQQRILRSNWTEVALWRARAGAVQVEAYEAAGKVNGWVSPMTNYSTDAGRSSGSYSYSTSWPTPSFSSDRDVSIGDVVTVSPDSLGDTSGTLPQMRTGMKAILFLAKMPTSVPAAGLSTSLNLVTLNQGSASSLLNIVVENNGAADMRLVAYNLNLTVGYGTLFNPVAHGQWFLIRVSQNGGTPANCDISATRLGDGTVGTLTNIAVDVRNMTSVSFPGQFIDKPASAFGGLVALGQTTGPVWQDAIPTGAQGTLATRAGVLANVCGQLPVTFAQIGTLTGQVLTGQWSSRTALEVLQEMTRTYSGAAFARQRDSVAYVIGSDQLYPAAAVATIDTDADCVGPPRLVTGSESRPTRVDVDWPGGVYSVIDATAELAGRVRSRGTSTVAPDAATAAAVGQGILNRASARNLRISRIVVSLITGATDHTTELFDEVATLGGLFPTQRIRTMVPTSHFGVPTRDHYVQGWEEVYAPEDITISMDTTPALTATLVATLTFTAADGSGLPGSWDTLLSVGAAGTTAVQTNRARETTAAVLGAEHYVRSGVAWAAGELVATCIPGTSSRAAVQVRADTAVTLGSGYRLTLDTVNNQLILDRSSSTVATVAKTITAGTSYGIRIRSVGKWTNIRVWPSAGAEPGTWDIAYVDGTPLTGDRWCIGCRTDGSTATARSADFDDITITDGA